MPSLRTIIAQLEAENAFENLVTDVRAQFGSGTRRYIGAELLPEQFKSQNAYRERAIRFRHGVIANASTRYSPVQIKDNGDLVATFMVELGNSDVGFDITAEDYDVVLELLDTARDFEAQMRILGIIDNRVNVPLLEYNEKQRWDAIVASSVTREGDGVSETIAYADPTGHRVTAGGTFSNDSYDPWQDLVARKEKFADLGYAFDATNGRIITSTKAVNIIAGNDKTKLRVFGGSSQVLGSTYVLGSATRDGLNTKMQADGMPSIETYDLRYRTQTGAYRFLPDDAMVFIAGSDDGMQVDLGDQVKYLPDVLGYTAVGRAAGQRTPGRVGLVKLHDDKPPRIETQAWQTSLPVITQPERIQVITGIA